VGVCLSVLAECESQLQCRKTHIGVIVFCTHEVNKSVFSISIFIQVVQNKLHSILKTRKLIYTSSKEYLCVYGRVSAVLNIRNQDSELFEFDNNEGPM